MNTNVEQLVDAHWEYVAGILKGAMHANDLTTWEHVIELIHYHYTTAMLHGYKHGYTDCENRAHGLKKKLSGVAYIPPIFKEHRHTGTKGGTNASYEIKRGT